ncbi:2,4-dienoyl-CoA reductase, partial [Pseudomonas aeruginosa]
PRIPNTLASLANMAAVKFQLRKLSRGRATNPRVSPLCALLAQQAGALLQTRRYRRLMRSRAEA